MIFYRGEFETDMSDVIALCSRWWGDSLFHRSYGVDYNVHVDFFRQLHKSGHLIYTVGRDDNTGQAIACYVGIKVPYMFNPGIVSASEVVWCVDKGHRSYRHLIRLLDAIDRLMDESGVDLWGLAVSNVDLYDSLGVVLAHRGYVFMDRIYTRLKKKAFSLAGGESIGAELG
jgi:hypothetical protein